MTRCTEFVTIFSSTAGRIFVYVMEFVHLKRRVRENQAPSGRVSAILQSGLTHYENTPMQIYRKFHFQKLKTFR